MQGLVVLTSCKDKKVVHLHSLSTEQKLSTDLALPHLMGLHGLVVFVDFVADVACGSSVFVGGFATARGRRDAHLRPP